jgi:hypothetical protein
MSYPAASAFRVFWSPVLFQQASTVFIVRQNHVILSPFPSANRDQSPFNFESAGRQKA